MVDPNRITHDTPELRDVLLGFLESASSLCDMMNTTMAAVLNEIMSIQADEACGAEYGRRSESRVNSRNGYHVPSIAGSVSSGTTRFGLYGCSPPHETQRHRGTCTCDQERAEDGEGARAGAAGAGERCAGSVGDDERCVCR